MSLNASLSPTFFSISSPSTSSIYKETLGKQSKLGEKLSLVLTSLTQQTKKEGMAGAPNIVPDYLSETKSTKEPGKDIVTPHESNEWVSYAV